MLSLTDQFNRPLRSLRISVTDQCNLRCQYCMPEDHYSWLDHTNILSFDEIKRLVDIVCHLGVRRIRLTGGEPLLRKKLPELIQLISRHPTLEDLALTTNGTLLAEQAQDLFAAGLKRLTVSLDTLNEARFLRLSRRRSLPLVLRGIQAALDAGFRNVKINTVIIRGQNEDEIAALVEFGRHHGIEVRFIEYMDVGGATAWSMNAVMTRAEILKSLEGQFGPLQPLIDGGSAPAARFRLADGTSVGVIASTTQPFCGRCDRSRLTADGVLYRCLYAKNGLNLRGLLRSGSSDQQISEEIAAFWRLRQDRGAEERVHQSERQALYALHELKQSPHLEMHKRGG